MRLAQSRSGSQKPHTSGYIRDTGFGIAPDRISLCGSEGVPMLLRVTKVQRSSRCMSFCLPWNVLCGALCCP